jgi:hypothetical protein
MFSLKIRTAISGAMALFALCTFSFSAFAQDPNQLQSTFKPCRASKCS